MRKRYVLGVDGGNTKTVAVAARLDGSVVGVGRSGCSDIYGARTVEEALQEVTAAASAALGEAVADPADLTACAFSMAGADWPEDVSFLQTSLKAGGYGGRITVVNDAMGALRAGSADGTGVAVVCGTGAATGARAPDGRQWHTGWWQEPQGSLHLAEKTMRAVYRAELGLEPPTSLTRCVLHIFEQVTVEDVLHGRTARDRRVAFPHGRLTYVLLTEAAQGDEVAGRIVRQHGASLGDYALAAARKVFIDGTAFTLVLAGGVLRHPSNGLRDTIVRRVQETAPSVRPMASQLEPVVGAVLLALESVDVPADAALLRRLKSALPAPAPFEA